MTRIIMTHSRTGAKITVESEAEEANLVGDLAAQLQESEITLAHKEDWSMEGYHLWPQKV